MCDGLGVWAGREICWNATVSTVQPPPLLPRPYRDGFAGGVSKSADPVRGHKACEMKVLYSVFCFVTSIWLPYSALRHHFYPLPTLFLPFLPPGVPYPGKRPRTPKKGSAAWRSLLNLCFLCKLTNLTKGHTPVFSPGHFTTNFCA